VTIDTSRFVAEGEPRRRLAHSALVDAPVEDVWETLTTSEGIRFFNGIDSRVELRIGGRYEWLFDAEAPEGQRGAEGCQILAYLPPTMLAFSWNAPPHLDEVREKRTWVVVQLSRVETRTRVELTHLGFGEGEQWDQCFDYFGAAWDRVLEVLRDSFAGD